MVKRVLILLWTRKGDILYQKDCVDHYNRNHRVCSLSSIRSETSSSLSVTFLSVWIISHTFYRNRKAKPVSEQVHSWDMCHFIREDLVGIWREWCIGLSRLKNGKRIMNLTLVKLVSGCKLMGMMLKKSHFFLCMVCYIALDVYNTKQIYVLINILLCSHEM